MPDEAADLCDLPMWILLGPNALMKQQITCISGALFWQNYSTETEPAL